MGLNISNGADERTLSLNQISLSSADLSFYNFECLSSDLEAFVLEQVLSV